MPCPCSEKKERTIWSRRAVALGSRAANEDMSERYKNDWPGAAIWLPWDLVPEIPWALWHLAAHMG
jgi:hypothetical protein